jgi:hypothetical protein
MSRAESIRDNAAKEAAGMQYDQYVETQPALVRAVHSLLIALRAIALILNLFFLVLGIVVTIRLAGQGSSLIGEVWASYGLSFSFLVFAPGLDGLILRAWPVPMFVTDFFTDDEARRKEVKTGWSGIWRALLVLWGGSPGAVYMVMFFTDVLPRLVDAW